MVLLQRPKKHCRSFRILNSRALDNVQKRDVQHCRDIPFAEVGILKPSIYTMHAMNLRYRRKQLLPFVSLFSSAGREVETAV